MTKAGKAPMPLHLKILGIGCRKSRALRANVLQAIERLPGLRVRVEEVTNVQDILEHQIARAPALLIDGQPTYQDEVPPVEELYALFQIYLEKQLPMKKILVPTDFSDEAANAYRFAQKLAATGDWAIEVMHAYHPSFDYSNPYLDMPAAEFENVKRELMQHFITEYALPPSGQGTATALEPATSLHIGFASEEIVYLSKSYDLIVMGTTGQGNIIEQLFGSVSTFVAQHAHCPVMLIPSNCRCRGFDNIIYASNYQAADEALLERVVEIFDLRQANVHFVHVDEDEDHSYQVEKVKFEQTAQLGKAGIGISAAEVECADVPSGILTYAKDADADLLVVGTIHRSFLERMFHKSITKRLTFNTTIPLLVLHHDN
jgi:nucleotide-binding universal stress UspA family protein